MKIALKILASLAVSAVCLYFATKNVDWQALKKIITGAKLSYVFLALGVSLITFWLRAVRWQILLSPFQKIPLLTLLRWHIGALLINNLLPLRMGEITRAYWAGHKSSIPKSTIFATIVLERLLDLFSLALITVALLFYMGFGRPDSAFSGKNLAAAAAFAAALILIITFIRRREGPGSLSWVKERLPEKAFALLETFLSGLKVLKSRNEAARVAVLSPFIWSVDITVVAIMSRSLGLDLSWAQAGLAMGGLILGVMIPAAPGAAGTYEAGGVAALTLMKFEKTLSLSFIFLLHAVTYLFVMVMGIPVLMIEGFNPKKFLEEAKKEQGSA